MTTSKEINNCLSVIKDYVGSFPKDNLPNLNISFGTTKYIVINTDPGYKSGDHWLAIVFKEKECFYFDSFGLKILDPDILNYVYKLGYNTYKYSKKCIQPWYSKYCGYYVICFILAIYCDESYENFILKFKNINTNDYTILNILKKIKLF